MSEASTMYVNAKIFTMDRAAPRADALFVKGDHIAAVGSTDLVEREAGHAVRRVDLDGRTVIPGFNDCHCHILNFGLTLDQLNVGTEAVRSIEELRAEVARRAQKLAADEWLLGRGYDQNALQDRRHPTRQDLDDVAGGHPVVLWHTSGHALTCNTRALELAGITASTSAPPGGDMERDAGGEPTGVLKEAPATDLVDQVIPPPTEEQGTEAIRRAMEVMAQQGITSASDASTGHGSSIASELEMYGRALASGRLAGRITLMPQILYVAPPDTSAVCRPEDLSIGNQPEWLRIGPTKIFSDGALTTRTAALRQPYVDDQSNKGLLIWEPSVLADMIQRAHGAGWQIATHAIGDRAIESVVTCYERALAAAPREHHRHRIEHCMLLDHALGVRIRQLGVVATIQPGFIARLGDAYIAGLGQERASLLMPMELFDWLGISVGFSSDRPVIPGAPLDGIRAAMQRMTPNGVILGAHHTILALDAIRHYTVGSAFATHSEHTKGALRRGSLADFTVLSRDPTDVPIEDFDSVQVTMTVVGGVVVFGE